MFNIYYLNSTTEISTENRFPGTLPEIFALFIFTLLKTLTFFFGFSLVQTGSETSGFPDLFVLSRNLIPRA